MYLNFAYFYSFILISSVKFSLVQEANSIHNELNFRHYKINDVPSHNAITDINQHGKGLFG